MARSVADRRTIAVFAGHAARDLPAWIQQRTRMKFVTIDTAGGPVGCDSVGVDKNERSTVPYTALIAATPLVDGNIGRSLDYRRHRPRPCRDEDGDPGHCIARGISVRGPVRSRPPRRRRYAGGVGELVDGSPLLSRWKAGRQARRHGRVFGDRRSSGLLVRRAPRMPR